MECGISTACFFPMETEQALLEISLSEVKGVEVFLNTFRELEPEYLSRLKSIVKQSEMHVLAVHPFTSMMESFFFASSYGTRFEDGVALYRRYFEACRILEAPILVFHGDYKNTAYPFEAYCKNYSALQCVEKEYGVALCQENVVRCKCGFLEQIRRMRELTDDRAEFVLDLKQARRAENHVDALLDAMKGKIRHAHLSDFDLDCDCLPPGEGQEAWALLLPRLKREACSMVVELYRDGFQTKQQLVNAVSFIESY